MLNTTEAAITPAKDFQESSGALLPSAIQETPLTITHSIFRSWAATKMPNKKNNEQKQANKYISQLYFTMHNAG